MAQFAADDFAFIAARAAELRDGAPTYCQRCGWPFASSIKEGCVPNNCSCRCEQYPRCGCGKRTDKVLVSP